MKKLSIFFSLLCVLASSAYSQVVKPDAVLSPNGPNTNVYWNVKFKTLIIPHFNKSTPPVYQDTVGAFFLNTDTTDKHLYIRYKMGAGGIIPVANLSDIGGGGTWGSIIGTLADQADLQTALNAKQASLGFTAENVANKATAFGTLNNTLYPTTQAVSNYIAAFNYITAGSANTFTNKAISGSTNTITNVPLSTAVTGVLPVANGGTGTSSPGLVQGTNITITGAWPNQTINSSGGGSGLTASNFVFNEIPSGTINGTNVTFTFANTPTTGTVSIYQNGLLLNPSNATKGYSIAGNTLTFITAPSNTGFTDEILVNYLK